MIYNDKYYWENRLQTRKMLDISIASQGVDSVEYAGAKLSPVTAFKIDKDLADNESKDEFLAANDLLGLT